MSTTTANEYQLRLANGAKLQEVLDDFAHSLAESIREMAEEAYDVKLPLTSEFTGADELYGLLDAADHIDPKVGN